MINVYKTKAMKKYNTKIHNPYESTHNIPISHMMVSGNTGSGKSNFLLNLLMQMQDTFQKVILVSKITEEPIYDMLKNRLGESNFESYTLGKMPSLAKFEKAQDAQYLMIFDDFIAEKSDIFNKLLEYGIRGRKQNMMCVFLVHDFFAKQLKTLRLQCATIVIMGATNQVSLANIVKTLAIDAPPNVIKTIVNNAVKFKLNACILNPQQTDINMKIRRNFNDFYQLVDADNEPLEVIRLYDNDGIIN